MVSSTNKPHALLVTYPLQGHIIPSVHLAMKLASKGVVVTFVNTEAVHRQTSTANGSGSDPFAAARSEGLDVRYELVSDGLPVDFDRSLNHDEFMGSLLRNMSAQVEPLARRLLHAEPPISCLIADTFFVWPSALAKRLGILYVSFWTEPALVFTLYYHLDLLIKNGHFASSVGPSRKDKITYIPGVDAIEPSDLMSYLQETDATSVCHQIIFRAFEDAKGADCVLCNTVQELERGTISALQQRKPFYAVGPIFPAGFARSAVATSLWAESDCSQWLGSRPAGSVLYVSFGSYAHVSKGELEEVACGVRDSGASFVWVLRPDIVSSDEPDPLPAGFAEDTRGRGVVVPWCCQVEVLSHEATGGFLTHCGWNSILESVWSGVPLLCFPLLTDQFTNRKLVVKDWRVGIDLGGTGTGVRRGDVKEKIGRLMTGEEGRRMREGVKELRRVLESATSAGGSSVNNFDTFVADLMKHNSTRQAN
ncbi:UDP-glycosyltransferase 86A1 [Iris pallida]|uniref:Glycosyltransferase n=1 Tax=Iris pallida TaxID=29817 RepID=A0AAX6H2C8_IRIPA|nr:UDP-glycosyltransferase 86A1 [Iris pallida]